MSSSGRTCPKCTFGVSAEATECPACGVVFVRFDPSRASRVPSREVPAAWVPAASSAPSGITAAAPPSSGLACFPKAPSAPQLFVPGDGYGRTLAPRLLERGLAPNRCLRCNAPAAVRLRRQLSAPVPVNYCLHLSRRPRVRRRRPDRPEARARGAPAWARSTTTAGNGISSSRGACSSRPRSRAFFPGVRALRARGLHPAWARRFARGAHHGRRRRARTIRRKSTINTSG